MFDLSLARIAAPLIVLVGTALLTGCVQNSPWRFDALEEKPNDCSDCGDLIIDRFRNSPANTPYDLAFIEFSDRGNLFSRDRVGQVYELLDRRLQDSERCSAGVTVIAYVHGWKHNASGGDSDILKFKQRLFEFSSKELTHRCLVGVYIGWRGKSLSLPLVRELTYWDRKSAAHQLGKGGLTEVLLVMEDMIRKRSAKRGALGQDQFLTVGHSFGATAVLAALNEIMLERVVQAKSTGNSERECVTSSSFGHGTVLLNPAVEANEILQLKEAFQLPAGGYCYEQPSLIHVISSRRDFATHRVFPLGQFLGTNLRWRQTKLKRTHGPDKRSIVLDEKRLDTTSAGNFAPFFSGYMYQEGGRWKYHRMTGTYEPLMPGPSGESPPEYSPVRPHLYARSYEPVKFIYTDRNFIANHNSVFNQRVAAYLAAIVQETSVRTYSRLDDAPESCLSGRRFDFSGCFDFYLRSFPEIS